jgi:hypothetical protein
MKNTQNSNFVKIRPVRADLFQAGGLPLFLALLNESCTVPTHLRKILKNQIS